MFSRSRLLLLTALTGLAIAFPGARSAQADTFELRLRSGRTLEVDDVRVGERSVSVTIRKDGGTARMDLPFARLDPRALLRFHDRQEDPADAAACLRGAGLALEFDLRGEAVLRLHQAAVLDPTLAGERDAGLAAVRALEAADALVDLETRLRQGQDPRGALTFALALLDGPQRASLSDGQVLRIRTLASLARGLVERRQKAAAAVVGEPAAPPPPAPAAIPPPEVGLPADLAARVRAEEVKARHARAGAADPAVGAGVAIRFLETAARAILQARRQLRSAPPSVQAAAEAAALPFHGLLVATYLDLADLYRLARRFAEARARVRAVLILDPGNEQAWEQRRLIEDDLRSESYADEAPYDDPWLYSYSSLYYTYGRRAPYRLLGYGHVHGLRGGLRLGGFFGLGYRHPSGHHGSRRVVGTRRVR